MAFGPVLLVAVLVAACDAPRASTNTGADSTRTAVPISLGERLYGSRCAVCHQPTGLGVPSAGFPPLVGTTRVNGPGERLVALILHGVEGASTVNGVAYASVMMPYGLGAPLSDAEVAAIVTFVRSSWANTGSPISESDVARVRAMTATRTRRFTPPELDAMR
jgi:mono/diheme cytochrome c family protein